MTENMTENKKFTEFALSEDVLRAIEDTGYTEPTQIQERAIPIVLEGKDIIGRSSTGTGKTAAFAIPAVELCDSKYTQPLTLILCPTRELAMQISGEIQKFAKYKKGIRIATIFGGQNFEIQFRSLKNANIVVGTPGRIMDHMRRKTLKLDEIRSVVLDEADEMLNMGFLEDIKFILEQCPLERQTLLFSATMPKEILRLAEEFQDSPTVVAVDKSRGTAETIEQVFYTVPHASKMEALNLLLQSHDPQRSIVFCNTKNMVDQLSEYLNANGFKTVPLHGDMRQMLRTQVMRGFKEGRHKILIATDVAARGIDVNDVEAVFNYDIPDDVEYYVHRIGRTGRAGRKGVSYTLVSNRSQVMRVYDIMRILKIDIREETLPRSEEIIKLKQDRFIDKIAKIIDDGGMEAWEDAARELLVRYNEREVISALLANGFSKSKMQVPIIKAPPTAANMMGKGAQNTKGSARRGAIPASQKGGAKGAVLSVNIGRNKGVAPNFIMGAIIEETGLSAKSIGKIDIFNTYSTVGLSEEDAKIVLEKMKNCSIKNTKVSFEKVRNAAPQKSFGNKNKRFGGRNRNINK